MLTAVQNNSHFSCQIEDTVMEIHMVKQATKHIKPSTPTPPTLRHFKIGFTDELAPTMNVRVLLFFSHNNPKFNAYAQLQESLEKTLIQFYPLAGRYVEETHTVDCSDQGAEFIHAKLDIKLHHFLSSQVNMKLVDKFFPSAVGAVDLVTDPLLAIQVTTFKCGGVALGVSVSHRISDASTLSTFLTEWAAISRHEYKVGFTGPGFNTSALFPARGFLPLQLGLPRSTSEDVVSKNVTKNILFSEGAISSFKEKALINGATPQWSKVQLVSALLLKAFIGVDRAKHHHPRPCVLLQAINLREKTKSFIPKDSCGNLCGISTTDFGMIETTEELAEALRNSIKNMINNYLLRIDHNTDEGQTMVLNSLSPSTIYDPEMANEIWLSSWCKLPFYEADFGYGRPIWVICGSPPLKNTACLMDDEGGGGVEACVCMEAEDVPYFEAALDMKALAMA